MAQLSLITTARPTAWVSAAVLRAVEHALLDQGLTPQRDGALPPLPSAPDAQVSWDECMARLAIALRLTAHPALGLKAGERATVSALHVVGHMLISCANLRSAIQAFLRFSPLVIQGASFVLCDDSERARFVFTSPACEAEAQRFCAELGLSIANGVSLLFPLPPSGLPRLYEATFRHRAPSYASEYERVFGCPVRFSAAEDALVFPRSALDVPYTYADDALRELLSRRAEHMLSERTAGGGFVPRVKSYLRRACFDDVDTERVARALQLSPSALRRRLSQEGTTFSALLDEVRRELALEALREPGVCIKVLSEQLGFSEPCAFHRAFRRWTGTTPARYREGLRAQA